MASPSCYKRRMKDKSLSPAARQPRKTPRGSDASRRGALTKLAAPSLVQKSRQKRSELMISELEAVALAMFEERGFATVNAWQP
jgi:hypothetical protein